MKRHMTQRILPRREGRATASRCPPGRPQFPLLKQRRIGVRYRKPLLLAKLAAGLTLFAASSATLGQGASKAKPSQTMPLMALLGRFTAPGVPAMGPAEIEVAPLKWDRPVPTGLFGNGMAQHPMLYIGEGYNKIFLVNEGKFIWTYSTGPGWEYDDVWMLSNGNILFTRMQYIAEVTPNKDVVWRYDAPIGTEIHTCQPIGLDKVLFILNGLPPKLMVVNVKTNRIEVQHELPAVSLTDTKTVHAQFRRVRYTAKGTYLVPFLEMNQVIEYN
jgi:hypothetical protein